MAVNKFVHYAQDVKCVGCDTCPRGTQNIVKLMKEIYGNELKDIIEEIGWRMQAEIDGVKISIKRIKVELDKLCEYEVEITGDENKDYFAGSKGIVPQILCRASLDISPYVKTGVRSIAS